MNMLRHGSCYYICRLICTCEDSVTGLWETQFVVREGWKPLILTQTLCTEYSHLTSYLHYLYSISEMKLVSVKHSFLFIDILQHEQTSICCKMLQSMRNMKVMLSGLKAVKMFAITSMMWM
jgi:hypothetical protein